MTRVTRTTIIGYVLTLVVESTPLLAQPAQEAGAVSAGVALLEGAVVSATNSTLVIRSADGEYKLFVLDDDTARPAQIPERASVSVEAKPAAEGGTPVASRVKVIALPPAPPAAAAAAPGQSGVTPPPQLPDEPIPPAIRRAEHDIQRQARRYRIGIRAGGALDPELIAFGVHGQFGPFFSNNFWARPNLELGFGEVTDLVALNFEGIFRVPVTSRQSRWAFFLGGGPALSFTKLGFAVRDIDDVDDQVDFDDFMLDLGLNVLAGVQSRDGLFVELKATAYAVPHLRVLIGYNF